MNKTKLKQIPIYFIILVLTLAFMSGCTGNSAAKDTLSKGSPSSGMTADSRDTDGDGLPDSVEKTYSTNPYASDTDGDGENDKKDPKPLWIDNPIQESASAMLPVQIKDARVEDNATADHLEIALQNTGDTTLENFEIYYTITDKGTGEKESYYQPLTLKLKAKETQTLHFDNSAQTNHYPGNMNGLYGSSANGLIFDVSLHCTGYQTMNFQVEKAEGTAEVAD